jgi:5-methylcytosine-specific restriction endonuclease McrA
MNRRDIYNKYKGHCAYCGKKIEYDDMTIDHIAPLSKGGSNDLANTIPSCQLCNNQKADRSIEEFRAFLENIGDILDENKQYRIALRYKKIVVVERAPVKFYFEQNHLKNVNK